MCARQFLKLHRCDAVVGGGNILWSHASLNKQNIVLNVQLLYVITIYYCQFVYVYPVWSLQDRLSNQRFPKRNFWFK